MKVTLWAELILSVVIVLSHMWSVESYSKVQVAVYVGTGAWDDGAVAFEKMLDWMNVTWTEIDAVDVNSQNLTLVCNALWMPGGDAYGYKININSSGISNIRQFVSSGGAYIGTCAGAYYAADYIVWEGVPYDYPLKLFKGHADGYIQAIAPWPHYTMTTLDMNMSNPINAERTSKENMLYYGGPEFYPTTNQNANYSVIATWNETGNAAIVSITHGLGKVLLLGPHPEIGINSFYQFSHEGSNWLFLKSALKWVLNMNETDTFIEDLNKDGIVNILDITIVARAFGARLGDPQWNPIADVNGDGIVNILGLALIARAFGKIA